LPTSALVPSFFILRHPPSPPLFPYTTLFRSPSPDLLNQTGERRNAARAYRRRREEATGGPAGRTDHLFGPGRKAGRAAPAEGRGDRKSTRLNSSHVAISYAVFCLKKKNKRKL